VLIKNGILTRISMPYIVIWCLCVSGHALAADPVVKIGVFDFPPFAIENSNGELSGAAVEIIRETFDHAGFRSEISISPYNRTIAETTSEVTHAIGTINAFTTDQLNLSKTHYASMIQVFFVKQGNTWRYSGVPSLISQRVLTVQSYNYTAASEEYQKYLEQSSNVIDISAGDNYLLKVARMINGGRVDVFNECRAVMNFALKNNGQTDQLVEAGRLPEAINLYIAFSKSDEADVFRNAFNTSFQVLLELGRIEEILKSYGAHRSPE
jgi:ABC-type amino acid transport substrate-binding protein